MTPERASELAKANGCEFVVWGGTYWVDRVKPTRKPAQGRLVQHSKEGFRRGY